jgi:hypothetical protein
MKSNIKNPKSKIIDQFSTTDGSRGSPTIFTLMILSALMSLR